MTFHKPEMAYVSNVILLMAAKKFFSKMSSFLSKLKNKLKRSVNLHRNSLTYDREILQRV